LELAAGHRLGPYEIVAPLGAGGMGEVYRARDPRLGREVAIKVLPAVGDDDTSRAQRFEREARAVAALVHPNVLTLHDVGEQDGVRYLVTELLDGETLADRLARGGAMPWREVAELGAATARGVAAAHERGIVHRDLKPGNLFRTAEGHWKVLDFGLAHLLHDPATGGPADEGEGTDLTATGVLLGTVAYMSPEQVRGEPVDARSDLFALGAVLHEALAGRAPFRRETAGATLAAVLAETPSPLPAGVEAPPGLVRLLERCLAKRREDRPSSAEEVAADLERLAAGGTLTSEGAAAPPSPSIAVLPFRDMSAARDQAYFCEGVAEEILHALTRVPGLRVAARTSSFQFEAGAADVREVAERLAVGHVLEGSVRRDGDRLRVTVQLIDAASGFHVWSERYDRASADVFAIQDEIAAGVAERLSTGLSEGARTALRRRGTRDLAAYERYLQGRRLANEHRDRSLRAAVVEYEAALELDPEFAAAWAGLADCHTWLYFWHGHKAEDLARAEEASARASELDPDGPEALAARGWVLEVAGRYAEAAAMFEQALAAAPDFYEATYQFARLRFVEGRYREAAELFERGARLDPDDYQCLSLAIMAYDHLGEPERAEETARRALARVERRIELAPGDARALYLGAVDATRIGDSERARELIERALALDPDEHPVLYNAACAYTRLGDHERAFELLGRIVEAGFGHRSWFEHDTDLAPLRDDPRFGDLLDRMR
jgi:TolB-like protein/Flp pilus assembly protein TadD